MSRSQSLTSIDVSEYDRIEAAMTESERGRWFLFEYARRNRGSDTEVLLGAIGRLEDAITRDREDEHLGRVRGDLMDMAHAIARTKAEIAAINAPDHDQSRLGGASVALDAIVRSTEQATSDILSAAEDVQEAAWTLRESGSDAGVCDELDRRATAIYTACSFQDLTAQRTARIIHTLRYLEERLASMMAIWGDELAPVPPSGTAGAPATDLCQSDVDRFIDIDMAAVDMEAVPSEETRAATEAGEDGVALDTTREPDVFERSTQEDAESADLNAAEEGTQSEAGPETPDLEPEDEGQFLFATPDPDPDPDADAPQAGPLVDPEAVDRIALKMAEAATPVPPVPSMAAPVEKTDIASAFADIDGLTEDEKRALFS